MDTIFLKSESDTAKLAQVLAERLRFGDVVGLKGDLGAGKTTLVRHLVAALGGAVNQVASPSFTLQNEYIIPGGRRIEHWDLYRLKGALEELSEPCDSATLRVIEWPERAPELIKDLNLLIEITIDEQNTRLVGFYGENRDALVIGLNLMKDFV